MMAQDAVRRRNVSVRFACQLFVVNESCYRYQPKLNEENDVIAYWLLRITDSQRNWGFGLCFLYLRNCVTSKASGLTIKGCTEFTASCR